MRADGESAGGRADMPSLAAAAREADRRLTGGEVGVPSFDALLGGALPARTPARPARRVSLAAAMGQAWELVLAQARLLPRAMPAVSGLGLAGAVAVAAAIPEPGLAARVFGSAVTLVVLVTALAAVGRARDPRDGLVQTTPVGPRTVLVARLALVLTGGIGAALVASAGAAALGADTAAADLAAVWLGPSLLSSAVAVTAAIWRSEALGVLGGLVVWCAGTTGTLSAGGRREVGLGALVEWGWSTTPWTVCAAVLLFGAALWIVGRPRRTGA